MRIKRHIHHHQRNHAGFTLVEILVVLAASTLLTAGMFNFMISQSRSYGLQEDVQEAEQNARIALELLTHELRSVELGSLSADGNTLEVCTSCDGTATACTECTATVTTSCCSDKTIYKLRTPAGGNDTALDDKSVRIGSGSQNIAYFISQDLDDDGVSEVPLFQYDPSIDPKVMAVTIISRTRNSDPRHKKNRGYRQIVLKRRVSMKNLKKDIS